MAFEMTVHYHYYLQTTKGEYRVKFREYGMGDGTTRWLT